MSGGFWLSDRAWGAIEPVLPNNQPGGRRVDDRRVISGIIHVLKAGWTCPGFVPVRGSSQAAFCSKATADCQPIAECLRRGL